MKMKALLPSAAYTGDDRVHLHCSFPQFWGTAMASTAINIFSDSISCKKVPISMAKSTNRYVIKVNPPILLITLLLL